MIFSKYMNQNMLQKNLKQIKESWMCLIATIIIFITTGCATLKKTLNNLRVRAEMRNAFFPFTQFIFSIP